LAGFFLVSTLKASGCVLKHFLPAYTRASWYSTITWQQVGGKNCCLHRYICICLHAWSTKSTSKFKVGTCKFMYIVTCVFVYLRVSSK
jgi:hypothetical protein